MLCHREVCIGTLGTRSKALQGKITPLELEEHLRSCCRFTGKGDFENVVRLYREFHAAGTQYDAATAGSSIGYSQAEHEAALNLHQAVVHVEELGPPSQEVIAEGQEAEVMLQRQGRLACGMFVCFFAALLAMVVGEPWARRGRPRVLL